MTWQWTSLDSLHQLSIEDWEKLSPCSAFKVAETSDNKSQHLDQACALDPATVNADNINKTSPFFATRLFTRI